jgi:DNA-binding CsgD family transcriptional regulator
MGTTCDWSNISLAICWWPVATSSLRLTSGWRRSRGWTGLHAWPEALVILDGQSRVRFVNGAGERFLRGSRALYVRRGGLVASKDARLRQQLQNAIRRAVAEGISSTFPLHSEESANPWTITVLPLPREQASEIRWLERSALVIIGGVAREPRANALGRLLGLSPREAELALALLRGEVPSAIADRRGVALTTVRSQIRSLFTKTGVNRISALVRLVSSLTASPSVSRSEIGSVGG